MSKSGPTPWQAPTLSSQHVVRCDNQPRADHLVRWAQQRAVSILADAEDKAKEAYQEAYQRGLSEGFQEAQAQAALERRTEVERRQEFLVQELERHRKEARQDRAALVECFQKDLVGLVLEVGQALALRDLQSWHGLIWQLLDECLVQLVNPPSGTVSLGDRTQLEPVRERLRGAFQVVHDPELQEWDVRVSTESGQATVSYADRLAEVRRVLLDYLGESKGKSDCSPLDPPQH